jgi:hypothetical protein
MSDNMEAALPIDPRVADVINLAGMRLCDATPEIARTAKEMLDRYYYADTAAAWLRRSLKP